MSEASTGGAGPVESIEVLLDVTDAVATITLNRPAKLNTMTPAMGRALRRLVDKINDDDSIRVVVLTGTGKRAFSAGSDVKVLADYGSNWQLRNRVDYARMLWSVRKPVIAKIRGYCIGGGLELALMSDIRVGDETASFAAGEIKLGWHGGAGNTQLLPRVMSTGRSLAMLLTGDAIDARTAHHWGLLDYLLDSAGLDTFVADLAARIARNAPIAAQLAKHLVRVAQSTSLEVGLAYENDTFAYCFTTADAAEGQKAFSEKRPPEFRGR
ncbi:MAG: enoyl-CoA hydratase/isomerase family protein [Gammaproteobacteria bacterium]|nr:enoyl-CoA hydratase/isomerase family protein [Gammaproteobacteria bacterium]